MENKQAETNNIIALCHIIDSFEEFEKRLLPMISPKYNRDFVFQLFDISKGKFRIGARKAKKFYNENKSIIDTINQYSDIIRFINDNYTWHGESKGNLQFFYEYILNYKEEVEQILSVLGKLKELGFWKFEFNENLDFTKEVYHADPSFRRNIHITYVANAKVIPNYLEYINYKTTDSNYKMKLDVNGSTISEYGREIVLNSLLFDTKSFPPEINRENTFEYLLGLKNEQKGLTTTIRSSVDLDICISDLEIQLESTDKTINRLAGVKNKDELIIALSNIRENVEKLKALSTEYDSSILEKEPLLTTEVLKTEKSKYLERRFWSNIDLD